MSELQTNRDTHQEHEKERNNRLSDLKIEIDNRSESSVPLVELPREHEEQDNNVCSDKVTSFPPDVVVRRIRKTYLNIVRRKFKKDASAISAHSNKLKVKLNTSKEENSTFVCKICGKHCRSSFCLKSHQLSHSNNRAYVCKMCNKAYKSKSSLRNHLVTHSEVSKYVCDHAECGKKFKLRSHLKSHQFTHIKEKAFVCTFSGCGKAYKTSANLKDHVLKHTEVHMIYLCTEESCQKSFPHRRALNRHKIRMHSSERKVFPCRVDGCERVCKSKAGLKDHLLIHAENKPMFRCDICSKLLGSVQTLSRHKKRVHSGERTHTCIVCGKSFKTNDNLKVHEFLHTGVRPYVCTYVGCEKAFVTRSNLKQHSYVHTGEKPFLCECGLDFRSKARLREHRALAHGAVLNVVDKNEEIMDVNL